MNIVHTNSPIIQKLINVGIVTLVDSGVSRAINDSLSAHFPWVVSHIDWSKLDNDVRVDAGPLSEDELRSFFDSTTLSRHGHVVVVYSAREPCVRIRYVDIPKYFDELVYPAQICYFVGLDDGRPVPEDFVEFEGMALTGFARRE